MRAQWTYNHLTQISKSMRKVLSNGRGRVEIFAILAITDVVPRIAVAAM